MSLCTTPPVAHAPTDRPGGVEPSDSPTGRLWPTVLAELPYEDRCANSVLTVALIVIKQVR